MKKPLKLAHRALIGKPVDPGLATMQAIKLQTLKSRQKAFQVYSDSITQNFDIIKVAYIASNAADKVDVEASLALERFILTSALPAAVMAELVDANGELEKRTKALAAAAERLTKFTDAANKLLGFLKLVGL